MRCELLPVEIPAASSAQNTDFSAQQLEQLRQVFEQSITEVKTIESTPSAVSETIQAEGISAEQQAEFTHLRSELARMSKLLEQQNLQLQQLRLSQRAPAVVEPTRNGNAEEVDLADIAPPTEKMKKIRQKGIF